MNLQALPPAEALRALGTGPAGLTEDEVRRRRREGGENRLERARAPPLARQVALQLTNYLALILWLAAGLCLVAAFLDPGQGMGLLALAVVLVVLVNSSFSLWQERRAERLLAALEDLLPHRASVARRGTWEEVPVAALVPGDVVRLVAGDLVPADCRILEAGGLSVDLSTMTGEPGAVPRDAVPTSEPDYLRARDVLLAGAAIVAGEATVVVFATGPRTELGKIARLAQAPGRASSPLQRQLGHASRVISAVAAGLGVLFFLVGHALGLPPIVNLLFAIGILVANVPEGLLPTVTLSLAMGAQRMARRRALVRHLPVIEALGATTVICTDKTGTLTLNQMKAREVFLPSVGIVPVAALLDSEAGLADAATLLQAAARCHDVRILIGSDARVAPAGDPTEVALVALAAAAGVPPVAARVDELPFSSDRGCMSTVHRAGEGFLVVTKGAPESVVARCRDSNTVGVATTLVPAEAASLLAAAAAMAERGLRVLAYATRHHDARPDRERLEEDLSFVGMVGLEDPPREEVREAVRRCQEAGIRLIMFTGDHPSTARALGQRIGLLRSPAPTVISGDEVSRMSPSGLQSALDAEEVFFARMRPEQKLAVVEALQAKQEVVAVTGDGVNDAPALRRADVGVAMGLSGTDVAREAADLVLLDDNFATIAAAIEEGRAVFDNLRKFLTYILTSNVPEIVPYLAFALLGVPLPLTIVQILAVDLGTDLLPALGLGAEAPDPGVMRRPPRRRHESVLTPALFLRAYLLLGAFEAAAAMTTFFFVLTRGGWTYGEPLARTDSLYASATAATFGAIVLTQVVNVFLCRSDVASTWATSRRGNRLLLGGVLVEIGIAAVVIYTPLGNVLFGTAPVTWRAWLVALSFGIAMFLAEEARKAVLRRGGRRPAAVPGPGAAQP